MVALTRKKKGASGLRLPKLKPYLITASAAAATTATATTAAVLPRASSAPATTAATTAAARAFFARSGNVYRQIPTVHYRAVHSGHGLLRLGVIAHRDEGKPTRTACGAIHHQVGFEHSAVRRESVLEIIFGGIEGKVSHKQFIIHFT
jgi:hypothetical protein